MTIVKLDELVVANNISNIKLLKIDTDGFEFKILRGTLNLINRDRPILFFEYDSVFLQQQNEDGLSIFSILRELGYHKIIYYDNYGKLLLTIDLSQEQLLTQLFAYITRKESAFQYYDVVVFHEDDDALADEIVKKEMDFFS